MFPWMQSRWIGQDHLWSAVTRGEASLPLGSQDLNLHRRLRNSRWNRYPSKLNIAPEKWWLQDYFPAGKVTFQGPCFRLLGLTRLTKMKLVEHVRWMATMTTGFAEVQIVEIPMITLALDKCSAFGSKGFEEKDVISMLADLVFFVSFMAVPLSHQCTTLTAVALHGEICEGEG